MATELLSPAGDFDTALCAFSAGADAVYCGLSEFSARASAKNLTLDELKDLLSYAHSLVPPRKVYVAFNTLLNDDELPRAVSVLAALEQIRPDALIVQDIGIARICRKYFPSLELHASTQLVAHNLEGVLALKEMGFRRVVLAREVSLDEISLIARRCGALKFLDDGRPEMELECFIHGALCYSISGLCLFGAMEKSRSGNRGACPYCCREERPMEVKKAFTHPFSMKDLRLGESSKLLAAAGVTSLKIEGRMKSPLYVSTVTSYYRAILDGVKSKVTLSDLETVFSRRTTELYFRKRPLEGASPIDESTPGHVGAPTGVVKRIVGGRDGRRWLCFHTTRPLELHDGLQFEALSADGRRLGMGISQMRIPNPPRNVCQVPSNSDVEILLPDDGSKESVWSAVKPGMTVFCSMSNAVKKLFPVPSIRRGVNPGECVIEPVVKIKPQIISACLNQPVDIEVSIATDTQIANDPSRTNEAVNKAFNRLGGTNYKLGKLSVKNENGLFVPMGVLNELRRLLVEKLDSQMRIVLEEKIKSVINALEDEQPLQGFESPLIDEENLPTIRLRHDQQIPLGNWGEVVVLIPIDGNLKNEFDPEVRLALPVWTSENDFNKLRSSVKRLMRAGYLKWEASDLATLRMLKALCVEDITADWTLYARNSMALSQLSEMGVKRVVSSPENDELNNGRLAESGFDVEFLKVQSTPLFISLTPPAKNVDLGRYCTFSLGKLYVTTRSEPRTFGVPASARSRVDISWDKPQ